jgi:hypothetical protein
MRFLILLIALAAALAAPARADDVTDAGRGVVRVVSTIDWTDGARYTSTGTGFAVSPTLIVTNYHVIADYDRFAGQAVAGTLVAVPVSGSRSYTARIIRTNRQKDLALLEIVGGSLPPLTLYTDMPASGTNVWALGFPGNVDRAVGETSADAVRPRIYIRTPGEISGSRPINGIDAYVHSAMIHSGFSGGPLVDRCGRVIGVNTFLAPGQQGGASFPFAVSNNELQTFLRGGDVRPRTESGTCVTTAERRQQEIVRLANVQRQVVDDCERSNEQARLETERAVRAAEKAADDRSETFLFLALGLLVVGGLALGASGIFYTQKNRGGTALAGVVGGLLIIGSAVTFILREQAPDMPSPRPTRNCSTLASDTPGAPGANPSILELDTSGNTAADTDSSVSPDEFTFEGNLFQ